MTMTAPGKLNLKSLHAVILDADTFGAQILSQMLKGLGLQTITLAASAAEAVGLLQDGGVDIIFCDRELGDTSGVNFIRSCRRLPGDIRAIPIVATCGYSQASAVLDLRDAGANLVLTKPITADTMFDRIAWVCHSRRPFIVCDSYAGPDRRFKSLGPPDGVPRRSTDLSIDLNDATEPNLSQDEIDQFVRPTRISLE